MNVKFLYIFIIVGITGCSSLSLEDDNIKLIKTKSVDKYWNDGTAFLISNKKNSNVACTISSIVVENDQKIYLSMSFFNKSLKPALISPSKIKITRKSDMKHLSILTREQLLEDLYYESIDFRTGLMAVLSTASAGIEGYTGRQTGASNNAINATRNNRQRNIANYNSEYHQIKTSILKKSTVMPNQTVSGNIVIQIPELESNEDYYLLRFKFASDTHRFYMKHGICEKNNSYC